MKARSLLLYAPLLAACAGTQTSGPAYFTDARARRASLEASLVNPSNGYSQLRLSHYASGQSGDWDSLPVWNPPASIVTAGDLANLTAPLAADAAPLSISDLATRGDPSALAALGEAAFFRYPVQLAPATSVLHGVDDAARYGFWSDAEHGVGGLVRVRAPDGATYVAYTCATCHAKETSEGIAQLPNDALDVGKLIADASRGGDPRQGALLSWGPGRVDVTSTAATEPVRIPDLRPVRALSFLHHTASVRQRDVTALAIRLETLVIVSSSQTVRPPREVALGLATYLWSLADAIPSRAPSSPAELRGQDLFAARCASCHAAPTFTGSPVAMGEVGTDPVVGSSADRHTGNYRVPSLLGVKDRGFLLHDASISSLAELLDPARTTSTYRGRLGAPVSGHAYGLDLSDGDRAALVAYVSTL